MKVAALQTCPVYRDKRENLRRLVKMTTEAAENGARLIVMPELATTGYSFMSQPEAQGEAEFITPDAFLFNTTMIPPKHPAPTMQVMKALASSLNVHLVWGMVEQAVGQDALYNSQVYMSPIGEFATYRKINRWGNDFLWSKAGRSNPPIIECPDLGIRLGLLICRDVRDKANDKWTDFYGPGDADVVCLSANWGDGGFPAVSWMDFVEDNKAALIVSNRYGQETCNNFGEGGACVIRKDGSVQCDGLVWNADCIVYGEL